MITAADRKDLFLNFFAALAAAILLVVSAGFSIADYFGTNSRLEERLAQNNVVMNACNEEREMVQIYVRNLDAWANAQGLNPPKPPEKLLK